METTHINQDKDMDNYLGIRQIEAQNETKIRANFEVFR